MTNSGAKKKKREVVFIRLAVLHWEVPENTVRKNVN